MKICEEKCESGKEEKKLESGRNNVAKVTYLKFQIITPYILVLLNDDTSWNLTPREFRIFEKIFGAKNKTRLSECDGRSGVTDRFRLTW